MQKVPSAEHNDSFFHHAAQNYQGQNLTGVAYWAGVDGPDAPAGAPGSLAVWCPSSMASNCSEVQAACGNTTSLTTAPSDKCDSSVRGVLCQQVRRARSNLCQSHT